MNPRSARQLLLTVLLACTMAVSGCALLIGGAAAGGAAGGAASANEGRTHDYGALTYAGTVLANVVYVPAKVVFAGAGATASGIAYVVTLGNSHTTDSIWDATVNGNYVLTPAMVDGDVPVRFVG